MPPGVPNASWERGAHCVPKGQAVSAPGGRPCHEATGRCGGGLKGNRTESPEAPGCFLRLLPVPPATTAHLCDPPPTLGCRYRTLPLLLTSSRALLCTCPRQNTHTSRPDPGDRRCSSLRGLGMASPCGQAESPRGHAHRSAPRRPAPRHTAVSAARSVRHTRPPQPSPEFRGEPRKPQAEPPTWS